MKPTPAASMFPIHRRPISRARSLDRAQTGPPLLLRTAAKHAWLALLLLAVPIHPASAQMQRFFARPGDLPKIDARMQSAIVESVAAAVDTIYVLAEPAAQITALWRARLSEGAYRDLSDPAEFVQRLEQDATSIRRDGHFAMRALYPVDSTAAEPAETPQDTERYRRALRQGNFGFQKLEILPGNIGYLRLAQFADTREAAETAVASLNFLANSPAVILDLRDNPGGNASMIRLIASYFFEEQQHLINWYQRDTDETIQSCTLDYVPGRRMPDAALYILTSGGTGSAAEEFTFDMQNLKRATIVGEITGGAGHTVANAIFDFDGFRVGMRLPFGRAYDPRTKEGWEGRGVIPDIAVPAAQALTVAHAEALKRLRESETDPQLLHTLDWALTGLAAERDPLRLSRGALKAYAGTYGPRRVFLEGDQLFAQREGRPKYTLTPLAEDLFSVGDLTNFRIHFERDAQAKVVRAVGIYEDGQTDPLERTK
jgi:hypothetical protein